MELTSVWESDDNSLLLEAIPFYYREAYTRLRILDATWGKGTMWRAIPKNYRVVGLDIDPSKRASILADNRKLPFQANSFNIIVFDPPHVTHSWSTWDQSVNYSNADGMSDVTHLLSNFIEEAIRVLRDDGILFIKIADQIHSGRKWLQYVSFVREIVQYSPSIVVCDTIVKIRPNYRPQPEGRRQLHARQRHSYWIVCRKGKC